MLKEKDTVKWNTLQLMMDHCQERRQSDHWNLCQHNIVNYLRNVWALDYTPEEINHVIGLIEVNAFEVKLGPGQDTGRGVFPLLAKLSHGCVSNCRYVNVGDGTLMECRATVSIKEGDEILDHYVSPLDNTQKRIESLRCQ